MMSSCNFKLVFINTDHGSFIHNRVAFLEKYISRQNGV